MTDPSVGQPGDTDRSVGQAGDAAARPRPGAEGRERAENDASSSGTAPRTAESARRERPQGMIPARSRRRTKLERGSMRVLATGGIIGLATVLGAVLASQNVDGWIVGLAVGLTSVILAALLWSSRQL
jgi:hypothetical protein